MRLIFLGRGNSTLVPFNNTSSVFLDHNGEYIIFDLGIGTFYNFLARGYDTNRIRAIFISHLHYDHIGGLIEYFSNTRNLRRAPVYVMDVQGLHSIITIFVPDTPITEIFPISPNSLIEINIGSRDFQIEIFRVNHTESSVGFRITIIENTPTNTFINVRRALALGLNTREGNWLPRESFERDTISFQGVEYNTTYFLNEQNIFRIGILFDGFAHETIPEIMPLDILIIGATWGGQIQTMKRAHHSSVQQIFRSLRPTLNTLQAIFLIHLPSTEVDSLEILNQARLYSQFTMLPSIKNEYYIG